MSPAYDELLATAEAAALAGSAVLRRWFRPATSAGMAAGSGAGRLATSAGLAAGSGAGRAGGLEVARKGQNDFVTRADRESEAAVLGEIRRRFPSHRILAEEGGLGSGGDSEFQWLVDPLDGTTNFLQGLPVWCVSVACRRGEEVVAAVVHDPEGDNLFTAALGGGARWNGRPMAASSHPGLGEAFLATGYPFRAHAALDLYLSVFRAVFLAAKGIRRCGAAALDLAYTAAGVYDGFFEFRLSPWDIGAGVLLTREAGGVVTDLDGGARYFAGGNLVAGGVDVHRELRAVVGRYASEAELDRLSPAGQRA